MVLFYQKPSRMYALNQSHPRPPAASTVRCVTHAPATADICLTYINYSIAVVKNVSPKPVYLIKVSHLFTLIIGLTRREFEPGTTVSRNPA
jgi:hypothetical protein